MNKLPKKILLCLKFITILLLVFKLTGCSEESHVNPDGNVKVKLNVVWDSLGNGLGKAKIKNAKVVLLSEYGSTIKYTNDNGEVEVNNLPVGTYTISAYSPLKDDNRILLTGILENLNFSSGKEYNETIYVSAHSSNGIVINELYFCGSVNDMFYCWDQYVELFNSSDSTKYLDGCILARMITNGTDGAGTDNDFDGDIDKVLHASKFPGRPGEHNIPFPPKSFLVLAMDAIDHSRSSNNALNLLNADWEFYNQNSSSDIDGPNAGNLINMIPSNTIDFNMPLDVGVLILTDGYDSVLEDGIDINTIIDGVEYDYKLDGSKTLDSRVDKGHFLSPPKYSGKSLQRRQPGLDSNNGLTDWQIIDHPTPGYQ